MERLSRAKTADQDALYAFAEDAIWKRSASGEKGGTPESTLIFAESEVRKQKSSLLGKMNCNLP